MDNQHRKISGYRELSQDEIDMMNRVKLAGKALADLIREIEKSGAADGRWLSIGKTDLQKGLMAVTRSIATPEFF